MIHKIILKYEEQDEIINNKILMQIQLFDIYNKFFDFLLIKCEKIWINYNWNHFE